MAGLFTVGVPVIWPVLSFSNKPFGSAGLTAHRKGAVPLVNLMGVNGVAKASRVSVVLACCTCVEGRPFIVTEAAVTVAAAAAPPPVRVKTCAKTRAPAAVEVIVTGFPLLPAAMDAALVQVSICPSANKSPVTVHAQPEPVPRSIPMDGGNVALKVSWPDVAATVAEGVTV